MNRSEYIKRAKEFSKRGTSLPHSKLDANKVRWIRQNPLGMTYKMMARHLCVHYRTVEKVAYYETWVHVKNKPGAVLEGIPTNEKQAD